MDDLQFNPVYEQVIDGLISQKYSVIDGFFSVENVLSLRNSLLQKYEEDVFKKSAIGNQSNEQIIEAVRGDFILWLDENDPENSESVFFEKLNNFINYLNRTCFMGITDKEFHYAVYPEGTYYKRHLDTFQNDSRRKLSIVCYLNDEDWKPEYGGQLTIYFDDKPPLDIYPVQGRMVIFESQVLEHEVKPVKKRRLSITGWLKTRS